MNLFVVINLLKALYEINPENIDQHVINQSVFVVRYLLGICKERFVKHRQQQRKLTKGKDDPPTEIS